jgi:pentatricopeptide repeat protein
MEKRDDDIHNRDRKSIVQLNELTQHNRQTNLDKQKAEALGRILHHKERSTTITSLRELVYLESLEGRPTPKMSKHMEQDDATDTTRQPRGRREGRSKYDKSKWMLLSLVVLAQGVSSFESSTSPSCSWPRRDSRSRLLPNKQNAGGKAILDTTTTSLALVDRKSLVGGGRGCSPSSRSRTSSLRMIKGSGNGSSRIIGSTSSMADSSSSSAQQQQKQMMMMDLKNLEQEIVKLGRSGKTNQALDLYFSIAQPTVRLMNSAIDACSRARPTRLAQAFDILDEGIRTKQLQPNVFTFGAIMSACARDRNADRALQVLHSMEVRVTVRTKWDKVYHTEAE